MKHLEELSTMTFYKERLFLPHGAKKQKGTILFSLNTSYESLVDKIFNDSDLPLTNTGGIYKSYYYDYTLLPNAINSPRIVTKPTTLAKAKKQRLSDYTLIKSRDDSIKTVINPIAGGNNLIYDMEPVVKLYRTITKLEKVSLIERVSTFMNTINDLYNNVNINGYEKSIIMVNIDDYNKYKTPYTDLLYNISVALHRSNTFISSLPVLAFKVLFYNTKGYFLMDLSTDLVKSNMGIFTRLLKRLNLDITKDMKTMEREEAQKAIMKAAAKGTVNNLVSADDGIDTDGSLPEEFTEDTIDEDSEIVDTVVKKTKEIEDLDKMDDSLEVELETDEELKREYLDALTKKQTGKSEASLKRDQMLREKQKDIKIKNKTIAELTAEKQIPVVKTHKVNSDTIINENVKEIKFPEVDKTYIRELYDHDVANVITSLNNKSIPVNIVNIDVKDTSDELTLKETYTVTLEDENRKRHTLKFSLPKFIDDEFIYVNGSKKIIQNQIFGFPVIKVGPDEVKVITNYNRVFIYRSGGKITRNYDKFRKILEKHPEAVSYRNGCGTEANKDYLTFLEYDEYAKSYADITINGNVICFNQGKLAEMFPNDKSTLDKYIVGYTSGNKPSPIFYEPDKAGCDFITFMANFLSPELQEEYIKNSYGKKMMYADAKIMTKMIPLVIVLSYFEGLSKVVTKFNKQFGANIVQFTDKKPDETMSFIKFSDGYLTYPIGNMEANLMFNGFTSINMAQFDIASLDERETYLDIFEYLFGSSLSIADALLNYYDFMIDPITLEVLQLLDYPTDIVSLLIFANGMLADNNFKSDIDLNQFRIRRSEAIPAILYKQIAKSYARYRRTANNPNPVKITMDENAVIKELVMLPTVEDYSELSPMVEVHKNGLASMKGVDGMNQDRAYKLDKRAYDDSMIGVFSISTDPGPNCGKIRQLVTEPNIINARGFLELNNRKKVDDLKDVNISNPVEMLTTMCSTHDEPNRTCMATKQTGHVIPVTDNAPIMISNGMDQAIHYRTGNSFSVVAKEDGKVIELDKETEIMIVEYKSGERQAIDLSKRVVKNGGGGFYLMNQLEPRLQKGKSFKKDTILAYDPKYYKEQGKYFGNRMTFGSLVKVVVASNYATYEDSAFVTKHMSEAMGTNISMRHDITLGCNSNVEYIVKVGDKVTIGDELIRYDTSYDDEGLNKMLAGVRDETKEEIINLGKSSLHSHYTGVVSDIYIYCTVDLDELSPSLRKIVKQYQGDVKKRKALLDKYDPDNKGKVQRMGMLMDKSDTKTIPDEYGKVQGDTVGRGVKIKFYITYHDELSDGDKLAAQTANKNTIGYQIPKGFEPYSESRPYEEISGIVAPSAILQRGTPSVVIVGTAQKVLIELKRSMYKILTGEDFDEILKQKQPYMVHEFEQAKESVELPVISNEEISILESVFELYKDGRNLYRSNKRYSNQDVILPLNNDVNVSPMIESFDIVEEGHNAILNDDKIIAITNIESNESIKLKL